LKTREPLPRSTAELSEGEVRLAESATGHRIAYRRLGEQGPRVLLIMGFNMPGHAWRYQIDGLSEKHQVIWFDHAGVGESGATRRRKLSMQDLVADSLSVMDHVGWPNAHVVGVSMGGMIAQELALRHRERVSTLTLIATHAGGMDKVFPSSQGLKLFARVNLAGLTPKYLMGRGACCDGKRNATAIDSLSELLFPEPYLKHHRGEVFRVLSSDFADQVPVKTRLAQLWAVLHHDTKSRLSQLAGLPTLVVKPELDLLVKPSGSDFLASRIPGARMMVLDDAGHGCIRQRAADINAGIAELIASHSS